MELEHSGIQMIGPARLVAPAHPKAPINVGKGDFEPQLERLH